MLEAVLHDLGDWKALAKKADEVDDAGNAEALGFRAAYHRLAGNTDALEKVVAQLRKNVQAESAQDDVLFLNAKALFINEHPDDGLAALAKRKYVGPAVEILCSQLRFREAAELAQKAGGNDTFSLRQTQVLQARALHGLGETDKSLEIFTKLGEQINVQADAIWAEPLIRTEWRLNLKEPAFDHAAQSSHGSGAAIPESRVTVSSKGRSSFHLVAVAAAEVSR